MLSLYRAGAGKFRQSELTQMELLQVATQLRMNEGAVANVDLPSQDDTVVVEKIYIDGKEVSSDEFRENYYYVDPDAAVAGSGKGEAKEVIVYKSREEWLLQP